MNTENYIRNKVFYDNNEEFKNFVDSHCAKHEISKEKAFSHMQVTITREYYEEKEKCYLANRG